MDEGASGDVNVELPRRIGRYSIEGVLGRGGMATVYLGRGSGNAAPVAIKVMQPELAANPHFVERFVAEVRAAMAMQCEHIVQVQWCGDEGGLYYMVMELVDGGSVADLLDKVGKLPAPLAAELFGQLMSGLEYAHARGVVHRDLKPANMLLTREGVLKVADFGVAKMLGAAALTQTGAFVGTPAYVSPEHANGKTVDARSDLFSAGVILYELLCGKNPHDGHSPGVAIAKILKDASPPIAEAEPTVPPALEAVVERLLQREPALRHSSASEVLAELAPYVDENQKKYPRIVAETLKHPSEAVGRLNDAEATRWLIKAEEIFRRDPNQRNQAAMCLYRAVLLSPENSRVNQRFREVCAHLRIRLDGAKNPKIAELESKLEADPNAIGVLQQLANLYKLEGNIFKSAMYLKRYLRLKPQDGFVAGQLSLLTGERILPPPSTAGLTAGVKTGGFRAAPNLPAGISVPGAAPSTAPPPSDVELSTTSTFAEHLGAIWDAVGKKLLVTGAIAALVVLAVRRVSGFIDQSNEETANKSEALAKVKDREDAARLRSEAEAEVRRASEENAKASTAQFEAAMTLYRKGDYLGAVRVFEDLMVKYPKRPEAAKAELFRGKALLAAGRYEEANRALGHLLTSRSGSPDYAEALVRRAESSARLGDSPQAIADCSQLLRDNPTSGFAAEALTIRGEAYLARNDPQNATADFKNVLDRTGPSDPLHERAQAALKSLEKPR